MTELATRDPLAAEIQRALPDQAPAQTTDTIARLAEWAEAAGAVNRVATGLVDSSFVPKAFQGKPIEATAAIMAGMELGFSPMASLMAFDVIQGRAAPRAITIAAVMQNAGCEIVIDNWTDDLCILRGRRKGQTEWTSVEWTIDRAKRLGLIDKDQWKKQPKTMLRWRATAELGRIIAADALLGVPYTAEELRDMPRVEAEIVSSGPISLDDLDAPAPTATPAPEPVKAEPAINQAQLTKLAISLKEMGITNRDQGLAFLADTIGRPVTSSKELTKAEASRVIEELQRLIDLEPKGPDPVPTQDPPDDPWTAGPNT